MHMFGVNGFCFCRWMGIFLEVRAKCFHRIASVNYGRAKRTLQCSRKLMMWCFSVIVCQYLKELCEVSFLPIKILPIIRINLLYKNYSLTWFSLSVSYVIALQLLYTTTRWRFLLWVSQQRTAPSARRAKPTACLHSVCPSLELYFIPLEHSCCHCI